MNAREWLSHEQPEPAVIGVLGAPISKASISPSRAWATPPAFREALGRFPVWDAQHRIDLAGMRVHDWGDVEGDRFDADASAAHQRIGAGVARAAAHAEVVMIVGGDNSLTRPAMQALMVSRPDAGWGLLTLDAHHDCRPADGGSRNGTPVRELIESGLAGARVAQVGIHPLGNAREHAQWATDQGVHVFPIARVRAAGIAAVLDEATSALRGAGVTSLYVDIDVDVVDRAFAPACPASLPAGLRPDELLDAAHLLGRDPRVIGVDLTEIDATADVNGMTVRLAAAAFLGFCSGVAGRGA